MQMVICSLVLSAGCSYIIVYKQTKTTRLPDTSITIQETGTFQKLIFLTL